MPRVFNSGANVAEWYERIGEGSSTHDVCKFCYAKLQNDPTCLNHKLSPYQREEPQGEKGWEGDTYHPPYDECEYECEACGRKLTHNDD